MVEGVPGVARISLQPHIMPADFSEKQTFNQAEYRLVKSVRIRLKPAYSLAATENKGTI